MIVDYRFRALIALLIITSISSVAKATTLNTSQDTYSNGVSPNSNYGSSSEVRVRSYGPSNGYLLYDLSGISGSSVESATLSLDVLQVKKGGTIDVVVVNGGWTESSLTASNQPALGATVASIAIASSDAGSSTQTDISALVKQWVNGSTENYGVALISSSINLKIGSKEGGSPATLDIVTSTSTPLKTHVTVPGDFSTINQAISGIRSSWCPDNNLQCSVIVGPGYFDGFVCCDQEDIPLAVIGQAKNATIIGPSTINTNDGLEIRDLSIDGDLWISNLSGINTPIKLMDIAIIGDGILLQDGANVDTGSEVVLSNVDADLLYVDLSSFAEINKSNIQSLRCDDSRFVTRFSYLGIVESFECNLRVTNSVASSFDFTDGTLKVMHTEVQNGVEISNGTALFGNSRVSTGITSDGSSTLKCVNVLDQDFNELAPDCSNAP